MKKDLLIIGLFICLPGLQAQHNQEMKSPAFTLPEVLQTTKGQIIKNKTTWEKIRRPEILQLFEDNIYGQFPSTYDSIAFAVTREDKTAMRGKAHLKEVSITIFKNGRSVSINLVLFIPSGAQRPVDAFLLINNRNKNLTDPNRKNKSDFWPAEMVIDSGYAIAAFHYSDLAPDDTTNYLKGVLQLYPKQLTDSNGMRAVGAWAWGAARVMDYFEKEGARDIRRVALAGHSRGGKAALWAAAQDQRFAICVSNCSGNTGAALSRRQFGETISKINNSFPHWFTPNYKKFNNNVYALPVDQHMLISLIAPRPVYATNASKDLWADPTGTFLSLKNAEKVYALYDKQSTLPLHSPAIDSAVIASPLGYHNREGEHDMTRADWIHFIQFANYHFRSGTGR